MWNLIVVCLGIVLPLCTASGNHGHQMTSSCFERRFAHLAMDANATSCSETGHERGPWWVNRWSEPRNVSRVSILGEGAAYQVRVGDGWADTGYRGGFQENLLCHFGESLEWGQMQHIDCPMGVRGRVVSIHQVDPTSTDRLKLCEVNIVSL